MCEQPFLPLKPDVTRADISKRLCGDPECQGCRLFKDLGILPLRAKAQQIEASPACCGSIKREPPKVDLFSSGMPCRGERRCEKIRVTKLPDPPPIDPKQGMFCGRKECPMSPAMSPGECGRNNVCLSPTCPWGVKSVETQSPAKFPCGRPECNLKDEDEYPVLRAPLTRAADGSMVDNSCGRTGCNRLSVCQRSNFNSATGKNSDFSESS